MSSPRPMSAELGDAGDFGGEADAARAVDAAVHDVLTSGPMYLSSTARLFSWIARAVDAEGHRLVLQVALAALVADRAIERMVDQQELHHAFARLLDHRRVGEDLRRLAVRAGAQVAHAHGAGGLRLRRAALHLDQAHAAIAGDRQPLVVAEARDFGARPPRTPAAAVMPSGTSISLPSTMSFLGIVSRCL